MEQELQELRQTVQTSVSLIETTEKLSKTLTSELFAEYFSGGNLDAKIPESKVREFLKKWVDENNRNRELMSTCTKFHRAMAESILRKIDEIEARWASRGAIPKIDSKKGD